MGFVARLLKCLFYSHMGDCDYFEYNSRQFRITGRVLHLLFFPLRVEEALMRMPVGVFGSFGGIDISHVPGAKERCRKWAMLRAYITWLAVLMFAVAAVAFAGVIGGIGLGIGMLLPGVLASGVAIHLFMKKPEAPEFAIDNYKELLKPLFPESDLPNLEPTALEAIEAILNGKELQNELGKAMVDQKVDSSQVMDSCLLVHPCIAAGNHGSNHEAVQEPPEAEAEEPRGSGVGRRTLLEGKLEVSEPECSGEEAREPSIEKPTVVQISPLAKMLEAIPEPAGEDDNRRIEMQEMPPGDNSQFCITADENSSDRLSQDQWRGVATTLDKFLGPRASLFGRGILPPETSRSHERGNSGMFLEDTPVHDGSHIVYVETPIPLKAPRSKSEKKKLRQGMKALERAVFKSQTAV
ncbi:hypothetical protein BSKO_03164 [Bryopsis sp. KO-2023]|nr:hypothetical protein BSKO_03164 [Bryopsis sp. KO-2023]